jgi:glycosyltransferase involved in cell wall biosynthesis
MPNSLLEAMAMGVPSVAFGIPPVSEIAAGKGAPVIVPLLDAEAFAGALLHLASSSEERSRTGEAGRAIVLERFSVAKNMAVALDRLAGAASSRRRPSMVPAHRSVG